MTPRELDPERYLDDFGEGLDLEDVTEDTVGETQMLHRRAQFELRPAAVIPIESNFEVGGGIGFKAQIEAQKNLFFGLAIDWVRHDSDETISDSLSSPSVGDLSGTDGAEFFDYFDRYSFLLFFDRDTKLTDDFINPDSPLLLRWGVGAGFTFVDGEADDVAPFKFDIDPFFGFLVRPGVDLRWQISDNALLSANLTFDWVFQERVDIEVEAAGDDFEIDDDIQFSSVNLGVGFVYEW